MNRTKFSYAGPNRTHGHIRSLAFADISGDSHQEIIIVGTFDGLLEAFDYAGNSLWQLSMDGQLIAAQTGHIGSEDREDIVACSTSKDTYIVSGVDVIEQEIPINKRSTESKWLDLLCICGDWTRW